MQNRSGIRIQCLAALCAAVNILGSFLALGLRLPVYLDSLGTVWMAGMFGPFYGSLTGIISNVVNGIAFDVYSFYYIPVQIVTACMTSLIVKKGWNKGRKILYGTLLVSLPVSLTGALITAGVFGGITSSGSSYLVGLFHTLGMNLTLACFLVQAITDYIDKGLVIFIAGVVFHRIKLYRYVE